jgi:hypothetical protein
MYARRLLLNRGGESILSPILTLTAAPDGAWTTLHHPRAVYYNGYTYFGWVNGAGTGPIYVASYNHSTQSVSTPVLIDGMNAPDTHGAPSLIVRDSDHKLLIAFCEQGSANLFTRLSTTSLDTDPTLSDGLAAAVNLDASIGASSYTYPVLLQLTGVTNDPIYLFYADESAGTRRIAYSKSTDNGATWSARTLLVSDSGLLPYFAIRANTVRIDIVTTDRAYNGSEGTVDLGHMYLDGTDDKVYTSAGVEITAAKPFSHSELTALETNTTAVLSHDGIAGTNPIFVYAVDNGSTITAKYARWDGAAWDKGTIYTADHFPVDRMFGGIVINRADHDEVFSGVETGASSSEVYRYVTADGGATFTSSAVTTGSSNLNAAVTSIENGQASLPVIWLAGTLVSSTDFDFGIRGLRR